MASSLVHSSEAAAAMSTNPTRNSEETAADEARNMDISAISIGYRPVQGMNPLVSAAQVRAFSDSIILQPVTPQALQPTPMHIVSACFPHEPQAAKHRSVLKAMRGRNPASSSSENSGKNIG